MNMHETRNVFPQLKSEKSNLNLNQSPPSWLFGLQKMSKFSQAEIFGGDWTSCLKHMLINLKIKGVFFLVLDIYKELYQTNTLEAMVAVCETSGRLLYIYPHCWHCWNARIHGLLLLPCTTGDFAQQRQALETIDSTVEGEVVKNMTCAVVLYDFVYLSIFVLMYLMTNESIWWSIR